MVRHFVSKSIPFVEVYLDVDQASENYKCVGWILHRLQESFCVVREPVVSEWLGAIRACEPMTLHIIHFLVDELFEVLDETYQWQRSRYKKFFQGRSSRLFTWYAP